ncbi:SH3-domain-containing protein [Russula earlei]|uniref:SH3-domain-containing protein n=1 Tax=Russula earlei TaxID=71964 RepID=A0ACC0U677_9AGAM|nr:SH3-domain-containing protein [Russula earlei]
MPFANLPPYEKDAFFALLDEYFMSRPDLLSRVGGAGDSERPEMQPTPGASPAVPVAAITAAQRALTSPTTSRLLTAGLQRTSTNNTDRSVNPAVAASAASLAAAALPSLVSSSSSHPPQNAVDNENVSTVGVGRVAAAAQAFSAAAGPVLPPPKPANPPTSATPKRKFGDVDVSSAGAMFRSLRGSTAAKNAPPPTVYTQPAFAAKKASSGLAPPPVRRVPLASPASAAQVPEPEDDGQLESVEEVGEWAEALYDYTSEEAGDLHLRAGERVRVTEQTSSDWWTGEVDGRSGLFPATYVKLL